MASIELKDSIEINLLPYPLSASLTPLTPLTPLTSLPDTSQAKTTEPKTTEPKASQTTESKSKTETEPKTEGKAKTEPITDATAKTEETPKGGESTGAGAGGFWQPSWWTPNGFLRRLKVRFALVPSLSKTDATFNTFALVNALILTIPFALLANINTTNFDSVDSWFENCNGSHILPVYTVGQSLDSSSKIKDYLISSLSTYLILTIYGTLTSLIMVVLYYLLRPDADSIPLKKHEMDQFTEAELADKRQESFVLWWKHGRVLEWILFLASFCGLVAVLFLFNVYFSFYVTLSSDYCNTVNTRSLQVTIAWITTGTIGVAAIYVLV